MKFDDLLQQAWQRQAPPPATSDLTLRVRRHRQRYQVQRALEVVLTLAALLLFGHALLNGRTTASHWLLMPFFIVYLPIVWIIVLRAPRNHAGNVSERVSTYAQLRMAQLRTLLRDLWLARTIAWTLLGYAVVANLGVWLAGDSHWRSAGLFLLAFAAVWLGITLGLSRIMHRRWLKEFRAVRRLVSA